jgi:hypothetical protein
LAETIPNFPNSHMLLQALFHCQVPPSRATWLIRIICPQWVEKSAVVTGPSASAGGVPVRDDRQDGFERNNLWTRLVLESLDVQLEAQVSAG